MTNIYTPQGNWCDLQSNTQTHLNNISAKEITMTDHGHTIWKNIPLEEKLQIFKNHNLVVSDFIDPKFGFNSKFGS